MKNNTDKIGDIIRRNLRENRELEIVFTKKDGTERTMQVTPHIPEDQKPKNKNKKTPDHLIAVFDKDNNGWRSIILENITEVTILE